MLRKALVELVELFRRELLVAEWAEHFLARPLFDAVRMEVVAPVAREGGDVVAWHELREAD